MKTTKKILSVISAGIMAMTYSVTAFADAPYDDAVIMYGNGSYSANILYDNDGLLAFENENGKFGHCTNKRYDFSMNYTVFKSDEKITPALLGLPVNTVLLKTESTASTETYSVAVETQEELDKLYEAAGKLVEDKVIINSFKQFTYEYGCFYGGLAVFALNEADEGFNPNSIEGLENINFIQYDATTETYSYDVNEDDAVTLIKLEETILAAENIADFNLFYCACEVLHSPNTIRIYVDEYSESTAEAVIGDANGDTALNVRDCSFIAKMIAYGTPEEISDSADFNADGKINVRDASAIAKYLGTLYDKPIDNPTV